jgi:hypothetical protein
VQVVCGCFKGNLDEFVSKVKQTHKGNEHEKAYMNEVKIVKYLLKQDAKIGG